MLNLLINRFYLLNYGTRNEKRKEKEFNVVTSFGDGM